MENEDLDYVALVGAIAVRDGGSTRIPLDILVGVRTTTLVAVMYDSRTDEIVISVTPVPMEEDS